MEQKILELILFMVPFLFSLSFHEAAHAYSAHLLGDDTANERGRMTLNPVAHIDVIGTLLFPIMGFFSGMLFGWAKPVPVNPVRFTRGVTMRKGMMYTAAAGPASNVFLALLTSLVFAMLVLVFQVNMQENYYLLRIFAMTIQLNIILAFFNLLPIPPLDGSKILGGVLPSKYDRHLRTIDQYGFVILILLLISGVLRVLLWPAAKLSQFLLMWPYYFFG